MAAENPTESPVASGNGGDEPATGAPATPSPVDDETPASVRENADNSANATEEATVIPAPEVVSEPAPSAADEQPETVPKAGVRKAGTGTVAPEPRDSASTIILDGVNFASDSDEMMAGSDAVLDNVIESLKTNPEVRLEIAGYTDDRGDPLYNRILSRKRAEAVMIYLVQHGIDARRLTAAGYGSDDPIADNDAEAGRQKNRRVELHIR